MRALLPICAVIALITGVTSATLWLDLRKARQANELLQTQLTDARSAGRFAAMPVSAANARSAPATSGAEVPACKPDSSSRTAQAPVAVSFQDVLNQETNQERDLMKDPEYRKLRLAQQRSNIERNYPGLADALGLSDKEADRLFDMLAENQVAQSMESQLLNVNGNPDQAAMEEMSRRRQALQREQDEALRAMLGSKYTQYQDYQQSRPARTQVMSMNSQLAQVGQPLTDVQTRALTTVMIAEQQRQRQESQTMVRNIAGNPTDPDYRAKMLEESLKRSEESNRHLIDAVAPHLNAKQVTALRAQMEQSTAMTRISMRMQIERDRLQPRPVPAPAPAGPAPAR